MRAKHWIVAALAVAVVASAQAYALTLDNEPEVASQAAELDTQNPAKSVDRVVSEESSPADVVPADEGVAEGPAPQVPSDVPEPPKVTVSVDVDTLIVGFHTGVGSKLMEAIVRSANATPVSTVSGPGTVVVSVHKADRDATIAQLDAHILVDYVAVPAAPHVTSSL